MVVSAYFILGRMLAVYFRASIMCMTIRAIGLALRLTLFLPAVEGKKALLGHISLLLVGVTFVLNVAPLLLYVIRLHLANITLSESRILAHFQASPLLCALSHARLSYLRTCVIDTLVEQFLHSPYGQPIVITCNSGPLFGSDWSGWA